jgi:hypothetical protein
MLREYYLGGVKRKLISKKIARIIPFIFQFVNHIKQVREPEFYCISHYSMIYTKIIMNDEIAKIHKNTPFNWWIPVFVNLG